MGEIGEIGEEKFELAIVFPSLYISLSSVRPSSGASSMVSIAGNSEACLSASTMYCASSRSESAESGAGLASLRPVYVS